MTEIEKIIKKIKTNGMIRRLDELGRLVIPIEYRYNKVKEGQTKVNVYNIRKYVIIEILDDQNVEGARKFDDLGRVTINKEIRDTLNWKQKDKIEIWNYGKYFILKKANFGCVFCNNETELTSYKQEFVCEKCKKELSTM